MRTTALVVLFLLPACAPSSSSPWQRGRQALDGGAGPERFGLTATPTPDGALLFIGGSSGTSAASGSVDRWSPGLGITPDVGSVTPRTGHSATLLLDGRVLVAGGEVVAGSSAELGDASGTTWTSVGALITGRAHHTATLLDDGRVLLVGGTDDRGAIGSCEIFDPGSDTFIATGSLLVARGYHAAVRLSNGQVLVMGGSGDPQVPGTPTAELWNSTTGLWSPTGPMTLGRTRLTATRLMDGSVLVTGGVVVSTSSLFSNTAEIYSLTGGTFRSITATMAVGRAGHSSTLLPDGSVLVAGGQDSAGALLSVERFLPGSAAWLASQDPLLTPRFGQTATLLDDGTLLLAGGQDGSGAAPLSLEHIYPGVFGRALWLPSATPMPEPRSRLGASLLSNGEVLLVGGRSNIGSLDTTLRFHPSLGTFTVDATLLSPREGHEQLRLNDGRILITGGRDGSAVLQTAELFNPTTGSWSSGGDILDPRIGHRMTRLGSGQVLITGGDNGVVILATSARFDPITESWSGRPDLGSLRAYHSATVLADGSVLLLGGITAGGTLNTTVERLDPVSGSTVTLTAKLADGRSHHRAARLPDGTVLITGGLDAAGSPLASAERFDPTTDTFSSAGSMTVARADHLMRWLTDGRLLILGGSGTASAEIYDPRSGSFLSTPPMNAVRDATSAAVLNDGRVLVAGGQDAGLLASAELYTSPGVGPPLWRPTLDPPPDPVEGQSWTLTGTGLRGRFGGGSGTLQGTRAELPFVHIFAANNVDTLLPARAWSDTSVTVTLPAGFPTGPTEVWIIVHAASSAREVVTVRAPTPTPAVDPGSPVAIDNNSVEACDALGVGATITVTPLDTAGDALPPGRSLTFVPSNPAIILGPVVPGNDPAGRPTYAVLATATRCDPVPVTFTITADTTPLATKPTVTFTCPALEASGVSFFADPATALADGAATATVTVSLRDRCGQPAFGRLVELHGATGGLPVIISGGPLASLDAPGEASDGTATFAVASFIAGHSGIAATVEGLTVESDTDLLEFAMRPALKMLYASSQQRAVVGEVVTLTLTLVNTLDQDLIDLELLPSLDGLKKVSVEGATDPETGPLKLARLPRGESQTVTIHALVRLNLPIRSRVRSTFGIREGTQRRSAISNLLEIRVNTPTTSMAGRGCECAQPGTDSGPFPRALVAVYLLLGWGLLRRRRS